MKSEAFLKSFAEHMLKVPMISSTIFLHAFVCSLLIHILILMGKKGKTKNELMFVKRLRLWPGWMHVQKHALDRDTKYIQCKGLFFFFLLCACIQMYTYVSHSYSSNNTGILLLLSVEKINCNWKDDEEEKEEGKKIQKEREPWEKVKLRTSIPVEWFRHDLIMMMAYGVNVGYDFRLIWENEIRTEERKNGKKLIRVLYVCE